MDVLTAIKAINQAAADAYDGGEEWGGKAEVDDWITDPRMMDGFGIKINGDILEVRYHAQVSPEEMADESFNDEQEAMIRKAVSYLKKKFKKITGNQLRLKKLSKQPTSRVESAQRIQNWVITRMQYKINNYDAPEGDTSNIREGKSLHEMFRDSIRGRREQNLKSLKEDKRSGLFQQEFDFEDD